MGLKQVYQPYFKMGAAIPRYAFDNPFALEEMKRQYHSITCENDMKPALLLDEAKNRENPARYGSEPAIDFSFAKLYLDFAKANGIGMRGHTLVWHNQTPDWFFKKNYGTEEDEYADRETMLIRLEGYIRQVLQFVQTEYPGVIYAWDVVNEAIDEGNMRESLWKKTVGDDFVVCAFRIARKYADPDVKLFYNDYDTFKPNKREAICHYILEPLCAEKLVDGMGMQTHLTMHFPRWKEYKDSLYRFAEYGVEIHITELDIHSTDPGTEGEKRLALRYKELFTLLLEAKVKDEVPITCVTFWGLQDEESWMTGFRGEKSHPLLFANGYREKLSYMAVVSVPGVVEGDEEDRLPEGQRFAFWEEATEYSVVYHVDQNHPDASDDNEGTLEKPFKTIQAAAAVAKAGSCVKIHGGIYREQVAPAYGGNSPQEMVVYENYNEETVDIRASEIATEFSLSEGWNLRNMDDKRGFEKVPVIWKTELDPEKFKGYNPFCAVNILHDRLFIEYEKTDMTTYLNRRGMVFCDGKPLQQVALYYMLSDTPNSYWVEANGQTVHFRLENDGDPSEHLIELTCREQCFAPKKPFLSYIKVKGICFSHAATGAPVPQRGALSCFRGHHWLIEDCEINWSNGVGIDVGNECWHHTRIKDQIIGHTVIRRCKIKDAGVCGIAGLFATDLLIEDNLIEGTGWQKMELSWEAGGIKVHNSHRSLIRRNVFRNTFRADHLWMDVGNENNRITRNLFLDGIEQREAIFIECTRDRINLIDHNIFWNIEGRYDKAAVPKEPGSTGWYKMVEPDIVNGYAVYGEGTDRLWIVHNLIAKCASAGYFEKPVAFRIGGDTRGGTSRDARIINNMFYDCKEAAIKFPTKDNEAEGNLYVKMPGGFLRVMYPAPENCLDLDAWQEFFGFDKEGQIGDFEISVDTKNLTLAFHEGVYQERIYKTSRYEKILAVENVAPVREGIETTQDYYYEKCDKKVLPGPFGSLRSDTVYQIDPRK